MAVTEPGEDQDTLVSEAIGTTLADCTVTPEEAPPEEPCPDSCVVDPNAPFINWTRQTKPFLNKRTCEYSVTLKTEYEGLSQDEMSLLEPLKDTAALELINYYGKASTFTDPTTGEEKNSLEICVNASTIADTSADTRTYVKMIALITVPAYIFDTIPAAQPSPEEEASKEDLPAYVVFKNEGSTALDSEFQKMIRQVARALDVYAVKYAVWSQNEGGKLSDSLFDPSVEADRLRQFKKEFRDFVRANDFAIRKPAPWGKKWADEFEIGFDEEMAISYVKAAEISCDLEDINTRFSSFKNSEPQNIQRTMYYVSKLPEMWLDATATEPIDWIDFLLKYTAFPPLEIVSGEEFIDDADKDPVACALDELDNPINDLVNGVVDGIVSLPDAFADRFSENLCLDMQGKKKQDVDFRDIDDITRRALDAALREIFAGDEVLDKIPELLKNVDSIQDLWSEVLNKLGVCGLLSLLSMGFECLFAGLSLEDALAPMIKATVGSMSNAVFEAFIIALPETEKAKLRSKLSAEFSDIPPPWEAGYRAGSYSGAGNTVNVDAVYEGRAPLSGASPWVEPTAEELIEGYGNLQVTVDENSALSDSSPAAGFYGGGGSIGTAAGNVTEAAFDAYKDAFFNAIDENLIDLDMVMAQLNQLPGAEIIARAFSAKDCPSGPPLFTPPIDEFLKTLELDFCRGHFALTMPQLSFDVNIPDLLKLIVSTAKEILKELIVQLIMLAITTIIEIILQALCKLLSTMGALAVEALTGGNDFRGALAEALCADDESSGLGDPLATLDVGISPTTGLEPLAVDAAVGNILGSLGLLSCTDASEVPPTEVATEFINTISALLTNGELLDLIEGNASDQTLEMVTDVIGDQVPELSGCLNTPASVSQLFKGFGGFINKDYIRKASLMTEAELPVINSICASPAQLDHWNTLRCQLLQKKGISEEECQRQINALTERAKQDLEALARMANEGVIPASALPNIIGDGTSAADCPTGSDPLGITSLLPATPAPMAAANSIIMKAVLQTIADEYQRDLTDRRGFLNMVLSDSKGRGYKGHETYTKLFGNNLAQDNGFFKWYSDNWASVDGAAKKGDLKKQWYASGAPGADAAGFLGFDSAFNTGEATGGYPYYIGSYLQACMMNYNQEFASINVNFVNDSTPAVLMPPPTPDLQSDFTVSWGDDYGLSLMFMDYQDDTDDRYGTKIIIDAAEQDDGSWSALDTTKISIKEVIGGEEVETLAEFSVTSDMSSGTQSLLDSLDLEDMLQDEPLPVAAFTKYVEKVWGEASDSDPDFTNMRSFFSTAMRNIPDFYMRKIMMWTATSDGGAGRQTKNTERYLFGYNENQYPEQVFLDTPEFLEANDITAEEIYERFGGNEKNPPYYFKNPSRDGWLDMMDKLIPEWDACDPLDGSSPKGPLVDFEDLATQQDELYNKYKDDERLKARPTSECAWAMPYSEVFDKASAAGVDTAIYAVIRIYAVETILKGLPVFKMFGAECFDLQIANYIASVMDSDLQLQGVWGLPSRKYYYKFMEQVVQMFGRQVDAGLITPTVEEQKALNNLNARQLAWNRTRPTGILKSAYNSSLYEEVEAALKEETEQGVPGIKTLLSRFILEELQKMTTKFQDAVNPNGAEISNIHTDLMLSSPWFADVGDSTSPVSQPWNGLLGASTNILQGVNTGREFVYNSHPVIEVKDGDSLDEVKSINGFSPFRVEKYIRIIEKDEGSGISSVDNREDRLKGVLSVDEFILLCASNSDIGNATPSNIFKNIRMGLRICFATAPYDSLDVSRPFDNKHYSGTSITESDFPIESISEQAMMQEKAFKVAVGPTGENAIFVPLAATEIDFDLSQYASVSELAGLASSELDSEENTQCLKENLANTDSYKMIFETCVPLKKITTWTAMYSVINFLPSLGWEQDGWEKNGGNWIGFFQGFRTWNRKMFEDSKKQARRVFLSYYHGTDLEWQNEELEQASKEKNRNKWDIQLDILWWKLSKEVRKPTDKNDELCP